MSEIGGEVPKIYIEDQVQAAKKALQEGNKPPTINKTPESIFRSIINREHRRSPLEEAARTISDEIGHQIEYGESSDNPLAYSLKRVITEEFHGKESLKYLLEPPVNPETDRQIKMVYVTQGENPRSDNDNIALLDIASF